MISFYPDIFLKENGGISPWQLHFAASLSSTDNTTIIEDVHTIIALQSEIVQSSATTDFTPFYCAIAKKNPNMAVITNGMFYFPIDLNLRRIHAAPLVSEVLQQR